MSRHPELIKFGLKIRELRLLKNLSQEDLADLAGLHRSTTIGTGELSVKLDELDVPATVVGYFGSSVLSVLNR